MENQVKKVKNQGVALKEKAYVSPQNNYDLSTKKSSEILSLCDFIHKQRLAPTSFQTPQAIFLGLQVAMSFGFIEYGQAYKALGQMFVLGNSVKLFGDLPLGVVEKKGDILKEITEYFLDKEGKKICIENKNTNEIPNCAVCEIVKKDREKKSFFLTKTDLENSGGSFNEKTGQWSFKTTSGKLKTPWLQFPKKMWKYRVRREALLACFPEIFYGHEVGGYAPEEKVIDSPQESVETQAFNKDFEGGKEGDL